MLILKHLHDWSLDELKQEVRAKLVYRAFSRIGVEAVPDAIGGHLGIHRWGGLGVSPDNLINVASHLDRRAAA